MAGTGPGLSMGAEGMRSIVKRDLRTANSCAGNGMSARPALRLWDAATAKLHTPHRDSTKTGDRERGRLTDQFIRAAKDQPVNQPSDCQLCEWPGGN